MTVIGDEQRAAQLTHAAFRKKVSSPGQLIMLCYQPAATPSRRGSAPPRSVPNSVN